MHVYGLHSDKRTETGRVLDDDLGQQPGIEQTIVGVDQDAAVSIVVRPSSDVDHALQVAFSIDRTRRRAGREELDRVLLSHAIHTSSSGSTQRAVSRTSR